MKKCLFLWMVACLFLMLITACAPEEAPAPQPAQMKQYENQNETPTDGGTLKLCLYETDSLNPLITQNTENIQTLKLIYDSLFTVSQDLQYSPNLCESYTVSADGLTYQFQMKSGVYFHDGTPFTAKDVDFSLRLLLKAESPLASKLSDIRS